MEEREKFVPYIPKGDRKIEKTNGNVFEIRNTKQEETFLPFSQLNSPLSKLCRLAAEDPLLRMFFFLKPLIASQWNEEYPVLLKYPLFLDFDEDFLGSVSKGSAKVKLDDFKQKKTETEKNMEDLSAKMMWKVFSIAVSDKQVKDKLQRKRLHVQEEEVNKLFSAITERHKNQFATIIKDMIDVFGSLWYSMEYYSPLLAAFNQAEEAEENFKILSLASVRDENMGKEVGNSISKLIAQRIFLVATDSFCMECLPKKGYEPYSVSVKYVAEPDLESICKKCGGKTIFHEITLGAPASFGPLFQENRLPEFIMGFSVAVSKRIKRVYVHKNVHAVKENGPLPGREVDVFAITKDNKIIIIEITTSKDLNKVWEIIHEKEKKLEDIPYDALIFVTPNLALEKYPRLDKKIRVLGARHIPNILDNVERIIDETYQE